ncbi:MAG: DUF72 domain-containing protein [Actinomycetota bacterium]|nr:DUF72 domain-containing protein [Actinomycetota bacterium]
MAAELALGPVWDIGGADVRTGTCSWTDPTLVKETDWYPKRSMSAADRLAHYAASFSVVEADSTYYFPPSPELARGWVERTPEGFRMNVKAYSLLTLHPTRPDSVWEDLRRAVLAEFEGKGNVYAHHFPPEAVDEAWERFRHAVVPLHDAGRLGAVLLQYPQWFTAKRANRAELQRVRERLDDLPVCVEFRAPSWLGEDERDRTLGLLAEHDMAFVVVDAPPTSQLPIVVAATSGLAVVRFHGRADDTWSKRGITAAERFRYLYDDEELRQWVPRVEQLAEDSQEVHLLMNNCFQDYGVRNAADLGRLLAEVRG